MSTLETMVMQPGTALSSAGPAPLPLQPRMGIILPNAALAAAIVMQDEEDEDLVMVEVAAIAAVQQQPGPTLN